MRLRVLSEAECYTRCYGGRRGERVSLVKIVSSRGRGQLDASNRSGNRQEKAA